MHRAAPASLFPLLLALALTATPVRAQAPSGPAPSVTVQRVTTRDITPTNEYVGRVEAVQSVNLQARVEGFLLKLEFNEGQDVAAGNLLFQIDPAPFQAQLLAAQAQLAQAQANLVNAQSNYVRIAALARDKYQPQSALDQATAQRDSAAASVQQAQANLRVAELNLGYTNITAPIDGRIGKAMFTLGNLVNSTSGPLATIVQLDPIRTVFSLPERDLLTAKQKSGESQQDINKLFTPNLRLSNGTMYANAGSIEFVNNVADPATGTVGVRALFPNPDKLLLPGLVVTVVVRPSQPERALLVPTIAVQQDTNGKFVLVVDNSNHVEERRITAIRQIGQDWVVEQGLAEGERVIIDGLQKVRPGVPVQPVEAPPPAPPASAQAPVQPASAPAPPPAAAQSPPPATAPAPAPPAPTPSASGAGR
jgi:membrane fusion protein (multidrug efflux system)